MTHGIQIEQIRDVIANVLEKDFDQLKVLQIEVHGDVDFDGDDVLRVKVVFEGEPKSVDTSRLAGVVRHVRPRLLDIKEHAFPIFSFISDSDYKDMRCAPA